MISSAPSPPSASKACLREILHHSQNMPICILLFGLEDARQIGPLPVNLNNPIPEGNAT